MPAVPPTTVHLPVAGNVRTFSFLPLGASRALLVIFLHFFPPKLLTNLFLTSTQALTAVGRTDGCHVCGAELGAGVDHPVRNQSTAKLEACRAPPPVPSPPSPQPPPPPEGVSKALLRASLPPPPPSVCHRTGPWCQNGGGPLFGTSVWMVCGSSWTLYSGIVALT